MKKFLPLLVIAVVVVIFFRPFLLNQLLPIPSDTIIGLYNPFRDLYAKDYPRGIPFKNFLITDPVRQQYPWRFESIFQEKKGQLPLWNPYNFAGTPLLANQQSAPFTPFNLLFFVLPFPFSWSLLIMLQPLLAAMFFYAYLRNQKLSIFPSLLGSLSFIFSGFFISWLEWGTIDMAILWLPAILLSIDKIFIEKKYRWYSVYFLSFLVAFFAGHLQTFVYIFLLGHAYMLLRLSLAKEKIKSILIGVPFGLLTVVIAFVQWFPLLQFILLSGRNADLLIQEGWFIPWQHIVTFFIPDFFGNPTTLNYWGVWNYAELAGYVGIGTLLFAAYVVFEKMRKIEWFFLTVVVIAFACSLPTPIAMLPLTLHIPFLSTAQPTRLLSIIDFSLCVLAAFGFQKFLQGKSKKIIIPGTIFIGIFAFLWFLVIFPTILLPFVSPEHIAIAKHNLLFPTAVNGGVFVLLILSLLFSRKKQLFIYLALGIVLINVFDTLRFAQKFTPFTKQEYLFPLTKSLTFLQQHIGNYRIMETNSQILPPNFSLMYHLQSVDGYDPLYIKTYGELIAALERNKNDIHTPFGFNRLLVPANIQSNLIDLLGVKYVLSLQPLPDKKFKKVFTEGQTMIYENVSVLPRAFFVQKVYPANSDQQQADFLFTNKDLHANAIVHNNAKNVANFSIGKAQIITYTPNQVKIYTQNAGDGFLILTDNYYPTWRVYVDGKISTIYSTDLAFRGVFVPQGSHTVLFSVQLW